MTLLSRRRMCEGRTHGGCRDGGSPVDLCRCEGRLGSVDEPRGPSSLPPETDPRRGRPRGGL